MQEDVAGHRSTAAPNGYATCEECGQVFVRRAARVEPSGLNDSAHSEFTEICPDCEKLDRQGERPILGDPDR